MRRFTASSQAAMCRAISQMLCVSGRGCAAAVSGSISACSSSTAGPCQASPSKALRSCSARSADSGLRLVGDDGDLGLVGGISHSISVKEQTFTCVEGQAGGSGGAHDIDGFDADDRHIEAHILIGFRDLYDRERAAEGGGIASERTHDFAGSRDGCVGSFHGFHSNAGRFGDNHGLSNVVLREVAGNRSAVVDILLLFGGGWTRGEHSSFREQWFQEGGGVFEDNTFVAKDFRDGTEQGVGVARTQREQEFRETPVGLDVREDLLVLDLSGHDGAVDAFALESFDQLGEFAEGEPVDRRSATVFDLGSSLFLNGSDHHVETLGARGVENQEWKFAVACDETEFLMWGHGGQ